jgi:hypothetical protein
MLLDARLPELAHVGVHAGQHKGVPDADKSRVGVNPSRLSDDRAHVFSREIVL